MTLDELIREREHLAYAQKCEYKRLGNTQRCQELFTQICELDKQISARTSKWRGYYYGFSAKHMNSEYRRYREYATYLDMFLSCESKDRLPMSMTVYFG